MSVKHAPDFEDLGQKKNVKGLTTLITNEVLSSWNNNIYHNSKIVDINIKITFTKLKDNILDKLG